MRQKLLQPCFKCIKSAGALTTETRVFRFSFKNVQGQIEGHTACPVSLSQLQFVPDRSVKYTVHTGNISVGK